MREHHTLETGTLLRSKHLSNYIFSLMTVPVIMLILVIGLSGNATPASAETSIGISVSFGPPALPIYEQPPCPGPGFIWTPGYWAWDPYYGYFWVPGTWIMAPFPGALWTPGYWGFADGVYMWNEGYWGTSVGFYGGIAYGFGYTGYGYEGGEWRGQQFYYNRSVNNIRTTNITNIYEKNVVVNNTNVTRVSYNGGPGGMSARPSAEEQRAAQERRSGPISTQTEHFQAAQNDPKLRASENKGKPEVAATAKPGDLHGREVVRASRAGAPYTPPDPKAIRAESTGRGGRPAQPDVSRPTEPSGGGGQPALERVEPPKGKKEKNRGPNPEVERPERNQEPGPAQGEPPERGNPPNERGRERSGPRQAEPQQEKHQPGPPPREAKPGKPPKPPKGEQHGNEKPEKPHE